MKQVSTEDCWLWAGYIHPAGYGVKTYALDGKLVKEYAHRVMYRDAGGTLPTKPMELDHLCRVKRCVNPAHLEVVTNAENMRRHFGNKPGHCVKGHKLTPDNTYIANSVNHSKPVKSCKKCNLHRGLWRKRRVRAELKQQKLEAQSKSKGNKQ